MVSSGRELDEMVDLWLDDLSWHFGMQLLLQHWTRPVTAEGCLVWEMDGLSHDAGLARTKSGLNFILRPPDIAFRMKALKSSSKFQLLRS